MAKDFDDQVSELTRRISRRFRKRPGGKQVINIRDGKKRLVVKMEVVYMYGNMYSLDKVTNKGKSRVTIDLMAKPDKIAKKIIQEKESATKPKLSNIKSKLKIYK